MPQKVIRLKGINRAINEFSSTGECEELINLRPDIGGGLKVVKPKVIRENNVSYNAIYEHSFGSTKNLIVYVAEDSSLAWIKDGQYVAINNNLRANKLKFSSAGNVLVIYIEEDKRQLVYKFENGEYVSFGIEVNLITDTRVSYNYPLTYPAVSSATVDANNENGYKEALTKAASSFYGAHPHGLCGAAIIGCEYELNDGNKVWSTHFTVADVTSHEKYTPPTLNVEDNKVYVRGVNDVTFHITLNSTASKDVKKINVYATRPVFPYDIVQEDAGDVNGSYSVKKLSLDDMNLAGALMYYQGSISADSANGKLLLNFGIDQAGEAIMDVNAGCINRVGDAVSYNNRFHVFNSDLYHTVQRPTTSATVNASEASEWVAYIKVEDSWILVNYKYRFSESIPNDFIYPMAEVKKIRFVRATENERGDWSVGYDEYFDVDLKESTAYNYSYAFGVIPEIVRLGDDWNNEISDNGQTWLSAEANGFTEKVLLRKEINAINVSAQYNPFVFPVNYSYSFGGEIKDIVTSYLPISSTQIGQYPLTVFTDSGIFALEQGSGAVLYGNIVPIQPHVIDGKATATPVGVFFVSSNNIYALSGRDVVNVSSVLHGDRELKRISKTNAYKTLCLAEGDANNHFYNFGHLVSGIDEDFEKIISGSRLIYDQLNNELHICSSYNNLRYSYVFNIDTKLYHKVEGQFISHQQNSRYVIWTNGDISHVVDLHEEVDERNVPILAISRPLALEAFYTHIQRLIMMTDANLKEENQYLCISVFGSDNLYDWKCIVSSQKEDTILRHIRTNKAAKSYKDYIIVASGMISTLSDLSDIITDYTVVNRRLG